MTDGSTATPLDGLFERRDVRLLAVVAAVELLLLAVDFAVTSAALTQPRYVLYPLVWVNVGMFVVWKTPLPEAPRRQHLLAGAVAVAYLAALLVLSGLVGLDLPHNPPGVVGIDIGEGTLFWQRIRLVAPTFHVTIMPFRVVGYLALSYLVYATLLDTAQAAVSGALGLVSCVSCSFPIVASLVAGVFGSTAAVTGVVYAYSLDIGTASFLLACALLYWRPGFGSRLTPDA